MATLPNQETRSPYPKSQYATTTRAHVTVDLTAGKIEMEKNEFDKLLFILCCI